MNFFLDILTVGLKPIFHFLSKRSLPPSSGTFSLKGIENSVEIIRDSWGVPHLYAQNMHDLFFAQGFVHAQERLWQMEILRRVARGKLSEIFGRPTLEVDRITRTFGFERIAKEDWQNADEEMKALILAYVRGINAFLNHEKTKNPLELFLIGLRPSMWQVEDTLAISRLIVWQLSHGWYHKIIRAQMVGKFGEKKTKLWDTDYPKNLPLTLPNGVEFNPEDQNYSDNNQGPLLNPVMGSNSWVIKGTKTSTGKPILSNDMHLGLTIPAIFYQNHLKAGQFEVTGVSIPGFPLVLVGHNEAIAWGATIAYMDCDEVFIENFDSQNPHTYEWDGKWLEAKFFKEEIKVKNQKFPHIEEVLITHHGPIISSILLESKLSLALQSKALESFTVSKGFYHLNCSQNWDDFVKAIQFIKAPQLNLTYADKQGNIGYFVTGEVPIRKQGKGLLPILGNSKDNEWQGNIPIEEMPHALNPKNNFIVTCNNRIIPENYPHELGNIWMSGYRAKRVEELIKDRSKVSVFDCENWQMDFVTLAGVKFVELFNRFSFQNSKMEKYVQLLKNWDGHLKGNCIEGTIYQVLKTRLIENILFPELGEKLAKSVMGEGFHPGLVPKSEFYGHDTINLLALMEKIPSEFFASEKDFLEYLEKGLEETINYLFKKLGKNESQWTWGRLHQLVIPHAFGLKKPLNKVFNRGPFPIGGDADTLCQIPVNLIEFSNPVSFGAAFRQVIDFSDLNNSRAMLVPGQSGHLASPHYDDFIKPWLKGEFHPMLWHKEEILKNQEGKITLDPKQE